ncbi:VENN motif pre-toxin domain-containing protein, partial [Cedecea sp. VD21]
DAVRAKDSKYASMSAAELRNTEDYQKAFGDYGIGGKYQMMAQSVSGILAGAAGGDFNKALAGGLNPVMAQAIKGTTEGNEPANLMAHAVWGALAAQLSGGNAAAGAAGAFSGELAARHIAAEMFPNTKPGDLNQDQKQLVSLLGTMAAGIAGGVVGNSTAAATTGAQAGKNAVENNNLSVVLRLGVTACAEVASCRNMVVEKGLGALLGIGVAKTAMDNLSDADRTMLLAAAMTGKADAIERLTPEQQAAYKEMVEGQKGTLLPLPALDRPLVDSTLTNPIPEQNKGTTLTTPGNSGQQGAWNTGNADGKPDTGGNTTVTPIPNGPGNDDLMYLSTGKNTARYNTNESIRFIDGVTVKDIKTGENFSGTVDLKPTLDRIQNSGSYPHKNDGSTFQNRPDRVTGETGLPPKQPGYYKEYVHPTPGISGPGPQRIVVGQQGEAYYTNDHYKTFIKIK